MLFCIAMAGWLAGWLGGTDLYVLLGREMILLYNRARNRVHRLFGLMLGTSPILEIKMHVK
jgi:hypothetical protein